MKWDLEFRKNGCEIYVSNVTDSIYIGDMYTNTPSHIKARNITHAKIIATALNNHYNEEEE